MDMWNEKLTRENFEAFYNSTVDMVYSSTYGVCKETTRTENAIVKSYIETYQQRSSIRGEDVLFVFGDILLKNASNAIREAFDEHSIFRAGGDEFSIIVLGITKEKLAEKIQAIRDASTHYDKVSFAIGGSTEDDYRNVRSALRHADEAMYEDKRLYYEEHPDKKR